MIYISQSFIKMMDHDPDTDLPRGCPKRLKSIFIDKWFEEPSETMSKGLFFESGALGRTRDGEYVSDLKRTLKGAKTIDQERLEYQIERFHSTVRPHFRMTFIEENVHPEITIQLTLEYSVVAHLDLISQFLDPTIDEVNPVPAAIVDIKVTENIMSKYGDFSWGNPDKMDHIQAFLYTWAYMKKWPDKPQPPFYYMIFEFGPKQEYKVIRKLVKSSDLEEAETRIRRAMAQIDVWKQEGWLPVPSYDSCSPCKLKNVCEKYKVGKNIQVI